MTIDDLNKLDRFAQVNGISLQNSSQAQMLVEERHLNGANVCQGGALFTLADLAAAGLTHGEMLTIDSHIRYVHPARLGDKLTAKATLKQSQGRHALIYTEIRTEENELIATVEAGFVSPRK